MSRKRQKCIHREPRYMTAEGAARWLGVSRRTVQSWWDAGVLPFTTIHGRRRVTVDALREWDAERAEEMRDSCAPSRNFAQ